LKSNHKFIIAKDRFKYPLYGKNKTAGRFLLPAVFIILINNETD